MEALFYDHAVTSTATRQADLRQALQAFLTDAASRSAVQLIALFVRIPVPSIVAVAAHTASGSRTSSRTSSSREGGSVAARHAATGKAASAASPSPPAPSRRSRNAARLAWCAWEADRRLRQAAEDASEMNKWLAHDDFSASRKAGAGITRSSFRDAFVVAVAFLAPHTRDDLVVYESWQRCAEMCAESSAAGVASGSASRTTRMLSPLRHARLVALSLGAPSLLLSWAERPTRCHLDSLLLPHQSLLVDLSWWLATASGSAGAVSDAAAGSRVSNSVLRDIFISDVQRSLKLPKGDSRCAVWISYATLLASLHPQVMGSGDGADGDGVSMDMRVAGSASRRKRGRNTLCGEVSGVDEQAFMMTYARVRQLLSSLNASQAGAVGRTQFLRVVLSYGGPSSALRRQLVHTCSRTEHGVTAVDAALLRTRSLVDVHALFGVLAGRDTVNVYSEAAAFVRTARRRASAGQTSQQRHQRIAVQSARVEVTSSPSCAPPGTEHEVVDRGAGNLCHNAFVERGARALARKLRLWERKRLGKRGKRGVHVRPRDTAAKRPMKRGHAEASGADSERVLAHAVERASRAAASPKTGSKRRAEPLACVDGRASASATRALLPPQKQRRTDAATVSPTLTTETALRWSEDVAGSG
ncbi:hypothetical protein conserved [Leishmania donovani]|uniref:Hypothetical_protein_conserved n=1 Tax=Leishmania donovani TaxID=5661 RepID=A0A504XB90_LEIDO|nr:hypothetical protein CGC20_28795 [Leishmania donovani]CAJ1993594.1 hypothetical protein conserved [Leishmania donovani]VDZ49420.1 hypothetical_protein_conserved [Leishmania donovani]